MMVLYPCQTKLLQAYRPQHFTEIVIVINQHLPRPVVASIQAILRRRRLMTLHRYQRPHTHICSQLHHAQ